MDSDEDLYYSSGDEDAGMEVAEEDSGQDKHYSNSKKDYIILKEDEIKKLQEKDISEICNVLSVSRGIACTLLLRENWHLSSVVDKWLADDDGVRDVIEAKKLKLIESDDNYCQICFETVENGDVLALSCGHPFCVNCWRNYLTTFINDGPECLNLCCPEPKCKIPVGLDIVESVSVSSDDTDTDKKKYYYYLYRSYIECSRNRKWCPAPGCEFAVEFAAGGCESFDVICDCLYKFCWNCAEECHRPVDCETVLNWTKKNQSDGENVQWISAFTKPCPKCQRPIEKNHGCNHMTCNRLCGHEFCWLCLQDWRSHMSCNGYGKDDDKEKEDEDRMEYKRTELLKYAHYYERWASNNRSRDIALAQMSRAKNEQIPVLLTGQGETQNLLQCVMEAWEQIVECRRVLKWTYAYGYYMDVDTVKKEFFEYLQGEAESALERLHGCAETGILKYVKAKSQCEDFRDFKTKLSCLTGVTRNYFQNLVRAMENKLCEVWV